MIPVTFLRMKGEEIPHLISNRNEEATMAEEESQSDVRIRRLIPIPEFNKYHPDPTPAAIRWMIFKNKNGFKRCVVRRGHRVLIDELEYFRWLEEQNGTDCD